MYEFKIETGVPLPSKANFSKRRYRFDLMKVKESHFFPKEKKKHMYVAASQFKKINPGWAYKIADVVDGCRVWRTA